MPWLKSLTIPGLKTCWAIPAMLSIRAGFTPIEAPVQKKCGSPIIWIPPPLPSPDTHVDILSRTRAAMHTTIAAAAVWQFEAPQNRFLYSLMFILMFLACYHVAKNGKNCAFVGAPFLGPLFGRTCWTCLNPPLLSIGWNTEANTIRSGISWKDKVRHRGSQGEDSSVETGTYYQGTNTKIVRARLADGRL